MAHMRRPGLHDTHEAVAAALDLNPHEPLRLLPVRRPLPSGLAGPRLRASASESTMGMYMLQPPYRHGSVKLQPDRLKRRLSLRTGTRAETMAEGTSSMPASDFGRRGDSGLAGERRRGGLANERRSGDGELAD